MILMFKMNLNTFPKKNYLTLNVRLLLHILEYLNIKE